MQPGNLTETLQRIFFDEVARLARRGLTREYRTQQGQQSYLRGKLLLTEQIRSNLVQKHRFYVRSQSHQKDHYLNQRIKQALRIVDHSGNFRSRARDLLRHFQSVKNLPLHAPETPFGLNRVNQYYKAPLRLANLICGGYLGGTFAGQDFGFSLLFDMSRVFELLVYYHLKALRAEYHFTLHYQPVQAFWKTKNLRPDFLIEFTDGQRVIIDTKWKILDRPEPADDDLRQLYAYHQAFGAQRGILLYPNVYSFPAVTQPFINSENQSMGEIQFVSILDDFTRQLKGLLKIAKR
jgi:5-methylcytosine-specific restriction enzyme subunit McrC